MKLLYGPEEYLIDLELNALIKDKEDEVIIYDEQDSLESILMEITTVAMFSDGKTIIIKNHPVLKKNDLAEVFVKEVGEKTENVEIIFILNEDKISRTNPLIKKIEREGSIKEFSTINHKKVPALIKQLVEDRGGAISNGATITLAAKLPDNLRLIVNEIEKLLDESSVITREMVDISVGDYINDNAFALVNAITASDRRWIVEAYKQKIYNGEPITVIMAQIASALNLAIQISSLRRQGLQNKDISDELKIHIFRVKKAADLLNNSSPERIEQLLKKLAQLDKDIKIGLINEKDGLDYFILNLIK